MRMSNIAEIKILNTLEYLASLSMNLIGNKEKVVCFTSNNNKNWTLVNCIFHGIQELSLNVVSSCFATIEEIIENYHEKYCSGCQTILCISHSLLKELISLKSMNYDPAMISFSVIDLMENEMIWQTERLAKCLNILNPETLRNICFSMTVGHNIEIRKALYEACLLQNTSKNRTGLFSFSLKSITLVSVCGFTRFMCKLSDGILIKPESNNFCKCNKAFRRTVLINGNLTKYCGHPGHIQSNCKIIKPLMILDDGANKTNNLEMEKWFCDLFKIIKEFQIDTILVSGHIDPFFLELCSHRCNLTCLSNVPNDVLNLLAHETGSSLLNSMAECWREKDVLKNIKIEEELVQSETYYRISLIDDKKHAFQSIVFIHVTEEWCRVKLEEFLHCAKKLELLLKNPTNCVVVVDGGGKIEADVGKYLNEKADQEEKLLQDDHLNSILDASMLQRILIRKSLASALLKYHELLSNNLKWSLDLVDRDVTDIINFEEGIGGQARSDGAKCIESSFDSLEIKLASWRCAVHLACFLLRIDRHILMTENSF